MQRQPHNFLEIFKVIDEFDDTESKAYINDDGLDIPKILSDQQYSESRDKVNRALNRLDRLVADDTWDRNIDIVGFSRGASIAREFSNEIFDTVGSIGLLGNHVNIGYAFRVDSRIGHVAHAVALNEHRALFPLTSVSPVEGASLTSGQIVEQGFIGDHSDIGGGWKEGDLSDIPLQWMVQQEESAGVSMGGLDDEYKTVENPLIHDKRGILARGDRDIYYPNDPNFIPGQNCLDTNRLEAIETRIVGTQNGHSEKRTLVDKVKHESFSGVSSWRYGNGLWMDRSFDADGRLSALMLASSSQPKPGQTLWEQVYGYDAFDSIETIWLDDDSERHFKYDALSRLTAELDSRVSDEQFYQYDKAGNRTEHRMGEPGQKTAIWSADYLANSNRLQSYGSTQVLLSGSGSTLVETSAARDRRHIYNRRNQIVATYINFQLTGTYAYNALGQRTHKMTPSADGPVHTVYHYGLSGQLMAETRVDSQTGKETHKNYLWMNQVPVAMTMTDDSKGQQITYLHTDHLNTPRKATNDQQTIVWQWQSDAFGMGQANQDPDGDGKETEINLRFAGQYYDHESGLFYNYHRYYDPETGRYSQSDPIGLRGGINTYAYVNSNPLVSTDPLGLFLFAFDGTGNDADDLGGLNAEAETNVSYFRRYYEEAYSEDDVLYQPGVGTDGWLDYIIGGATGLGSRERVNDALYMLDVLLRRDSWDRTIDIVGFSRGAAAAREFSNEIFERIDNNHWANVSECNPLNVRFMGLFDTVGSMGLAGNSTDIGYDFSVDSRIGHVAHAVALNEHRALFPLSSVSPNEGADISSGGNIVEQGFVGAHSDIGGGYGDSDLSDIALQWMYHQALSAGVELGDLKDEHKVVEKPVIHDERGWLGKLGNEDRAIYYPNDPDFKPTPTSKCERKVDNRCVQYQAARESERQRTAPQFPDLEHMIQSKPDGNFRGTVNMDLYQVWLDENGVFGDG